MKGKQSEQKQIESGLYADDTLLSVQRVRAMKGNIFHFSLWTGNVSVLPAKLCFVLFFVWIYFGNIVVVIVSVCLGVCCIYT